MTSVPREQFGPIVTVVCCRAWPVFAWWPLGRCGLCRQVPQRAA